MSDTPPIFTSVDQFTFDEGQALAAVSEMTNLHAFNKDLQDATVWVNRGNKATDLINLLAFEGVSDYTHAEIHDPGGIPTIISIIDVMASNYLHAVAEIKECDIKSALSFLIEEFDGPPLSLADKVTFAIGAFGLVLALISPIPGDETAIAGWLATAGILVSGVDVLFTTGQHFLSDEDSSTFMFFVSILLSGLPILPGLGQVGRSANASVAATEASDAIISSALVNRLAQLNELNGLRAVPLLSLIEHPDLIQDLAGAWGVTTEVARARLQQAAAQAKELEELMDALHLQVDNGGRGAVPPPPFPDLPEVHTDEYRLQAYLEHQGVSKADATQAIRTWKGQDGYLHQYELWEKYPNISLPPDLAQVRSDMVLREGRYAD